jgi:hypothetical protein
VRRFTAAAGVLLFLFLSVAVAEASLLLLVLVFGSVLNVYVSIEAGARIFQMNRFWYWTGASLSVSVQEAGTVASWLFTAGAGVFAAAWQFRRWRQPA